MSIDYPTFFQSTFALQQSDTILVLTNPASVSESRYAMAERWHAGFVEAAEKVGATVYPLAVYANTVGNGAPLPEFCQIGGEEVSIESLLSEATLAVALAAYSATGPLLDATRRYPKLRAASLPAVIPAMEDTALRADPAVLIARNRKLQTLLDNSMMAKITFATDDQIEIDLRFNSKHSNKAVMDSGYLPPDASGRLINLPSGETWRSPYEETDPALVDNAPEQQSRTNGVLPVKDKGTGEITRLVVQRGRILTVEGNGEKAEQYRAVFAVDPARRNIAEFGLGSNPNAIVRGVILEDEKAGPHIAYGRSDYLGGLISDKHFIQSGNVLHIDIVYAAQSPINIKKMVFVSESGEEQTIISEESNGQYVDTVFLD